MNSLKTAIMLVSISSVLVFAGRDVVFIGLEGDGAPAVEKTYDRLLREQLSVLPDVRAIDFVESQKYRQRINFSEFPTVSRALVEKLDRFTSDTTLLVWGTVKQYRIRAVRKGIFRAAIKGELVIGLTMYSLSNKAYAYAGDVKAAVAKSKGWVGFNRVEKVVHISALDRTEILEKLEEEAVRISGRMISAVVRSETSQDEELRSGPDVDVERYRVPSLSDVFSVPSVEAKTIETANDSAVIPADSGTDTIPVLDAEPVTPETAE